MVLGALGLLGALRILGVLRIFRILGVIGVLGGTQGTRELQTLHWEVNADKLMALWFLSFPPSAHRTADTDVDEGSG